MSVIFRRSNKRVSRATRECMYGWKCCRGHKNAKQIRREMKRKEEREWKREIY